MGRHGSGLRTLDIPEPQALLHCDGEDEEFCWHHRILLRRIGDGEHWVKVSPDGELNVKDLFACRHRVLARNSRFPGTEENIYSFDPVSRADIGVWKKMAEVQARVLSSAPEQFRMGASVWLITGPKEPLHQYKIGDQAFQDILDDPNLFQCFGTRGVAMAEGDPAFV